MQNITHSQNRNFNDMKNLIENYTKSPHSTESARERWVEHMVNIIDRMFLKNDCFTQSQYDELFSLLGKIK